MWWSGAWPSSSSLPVFIHVTSWKLCAHTPVASFCEHQFSEFQYLFLNQKARMFHQGQDAAIVCHLRRRGSRATLLSVNWSSSGVLPLLPAVYCRTPSLSSIKNRTMLKIFLPRRTKNAVRWLQREPLPTPSLSERLLERIPGKAKVQGSIFLLMLRFLQRSFSAIWTSLNS